MNDYIFKNFWGITASVLGSYEALAFLTNKRTPTLSSWCARRRERRLILVGWTLGLALHIARHKAEEL